MIQDFINQLEKKEDLDFHSMQSAIESIMAGGVDDLSIEAFLLALNAKGIKETEITAAARVMKEKSLTCPLGDGDHIDTCGTGGSGLHTFNCSTAASFVAAAYAYGRSYYPTWPEGTVDGMTDAQLAVLQPPHHVRLDRTTLDDQGRVAGTQTRDDFKKEHDALVFKNRYF